MARLGDWNISVLFPPIIATLFFFTFNWLGRSKGRFWNWPNFYLGPTLSTTSAAFLTSQILPRFQVAELDNQILTLL